MILPVSLRNKADAGIIQRIRQEQNRSEVVRLALTQYYARQDAEADLLQELAVQIAKVDSDIVRLCTMIAKMLEPVE